MDIKKLALGLGAFLGGTAALTGAAVALGRYRPSPKPAGQDDAAPQPPAAADGPAPSFAPVRESAPAGDEGHAADDLAGDAPVTLRSRAPDAFRPDMDAPMTAAEREALRPATGPAPTLVGGGTSLPANG